jgi:tRNA pseudouridine32 synthase/23S rRNA pseudouridine746 synthase
MKQLMIDLLYQDKNLIVINKPPCISCNFETSSESITQLVRSTFSIKILYPVHRLDRLTSGILLFALNKHTASELGKLFENHEIYKMYVAITGSKPRKKQGTIRGDMVKSRRGTWKLLRSKSNPAVTRFISTSFQPGKRVFLLFPQTGKTHQLRVALKSISAPILGDTLYGSIDENRQYDRMYLHAWKLQFTLDKKHYNFTAPAKPGLFFEDQIFKKILQKYDLVETL